MPTTAKAARPRAGAGKRRLPRLLLASVTAVALTTAPLSAALAQDGGGQEAPRTPEGLATEGLERLLQALEALIGMVPQYELPEITEEGDIIIRRKRSAPDSAPETLPEGDSADTPTDT